MDGIKQKGLKEFIQDDSFLSKKVSYEGNMHSLNDSNDFDNNINKVYKSYYDFVNQKKIIFN